MNAIKAAQDILRDMNIDGKYVKINKEGKVINNREEVEI